MEVLALSSDGSVRLDAAPELAQLAALVLAHLDGSATAFAGAMPDDPLSRLELEQSIASVGQQATALAGENASAAQKALAAWSSGRAVRASADDAWAWSQAFNGAYTRLRTDALDREGVDCAAGTPAALDMDAELAAFMGQSPSPSASVDEAGWDELTVIFAVLSSDCLELMESLSL